MMNRSGTSNRRNGPMQKILVAAVITLGIGGMRFPAWAQSPDWVVEAVADVSASAQCSLAYAPDNDPSIAYPANGVIVIAHWNGSSFKLDTFPYPMVRLSGTGPEDVWVADFDGGIWHYAPP